VTAQLALAPVPVGTQLKGLNLPGSLEPNATAPVGVDAAKLSVTVAVQLVECPNTTTAGTQLTVVDVPLVSSAT
jgi:hypothetical protein